MKDLILEIDSRVKSPIFGYFIFSFFAFNWAPLFFIFFDSGSAASRLKYFQDASDSYTLFLYPFLTSCGYALLYPWLRLLFIFVAQKPTQLYNNIQANTESNLLKKKRELELDRAKFLDAAEANVIGQAKREFELSKIDDEDIKAKAISKIEKLRTGGFDDGDNSFSLDDEHIKILRWVTDNDGEVLRDKLVNSAIFSKVKTEFLLSNLQEHGYIEIEYRQGRVNDYMCLLTNKGRKVMVDDGTAT